MSSRGSGLESVFLMSLLEESSSENLRISILCSYFVPLKRRFTYRPGRWICSGGMSPISTISSASTMTVFAAPIYLVSFDLTGI